MDDALMDREAPATLRLRARNHPSYRAFVVHRVSGIALSIFLPFHFWALAQALQGEAGLDRFLRWTDQPLVRFGEFVLVTLLAAHAACGLRLLFLEFFPWRGRDKTLATLAFGASIVVGLAFLLNLI